MKVRSFVSSGDIQNALEHTERQYEQWLEEYGNIHATIHNISVETIVNTQLRYTHIITVTYLVKSEVELNNWKPQTGEVKASWPDQFKWNLTQIGTNDPHLHTYGERGYCTICGVNEPREHIKINHPPHPSCITDHLCTWDNTCQYCIEQKRIRPQLEEDMNTGETDDEN